MMALSCKDDCAQMLKRIITLEQSSKEQAKRIETLEMGVVFCNSNGQADTMRIQHLEEYLEDAISMIAVMSNHLCTCNEEVCVLQSTCVLGS